MAFRNRASALDVASALAGGAFFSITLFFLLGAAVWASLSLMRAPLAFIGVGEALAMAVSLVIGVLVVRNALKLAAEEAV